MMTLFTNLYILTKQKLRDVNNLTNLKSYYIKTLFLLKDEKVDKSYWNQRMEIIFFDVSNIWFIRLISYSNKVTRYVLQIFDELIKCLNAKKLPFFWDKDYNLFGRYNDNQMRALIGYYNKCYAQLQNAQANKTWNILHSLLCKYNYFF